MSQGKGRNHHEQQLPAQRSRYTLNSSHLRKAILQPTGNSSSIVCYALDYHMLIGGLAVLFCYKGRFCFPSYRRWSRGLYTKCRLWNNQILIPVRLGKYPKTHVCFAVNYTVLQLESMSRFVDNSLPWPGKIGQKHEIIDRGLRVLEFNLQTRSSVFLTPSPPTILPPPRIPFKSSAPQHHSSGDTMGRRNCCVIIFTYDQRILNDDPPLKSRSN